MQIGLSKCEIQFTNAVSVYYNLWPFKFLLARILGAHPGTSSLISNAVLLFHSEGLKRLLNHNL